MSVAIVTGSAFFLARIEERLLRGRAIIPPNNCTDFSP